MYSMNGAYRKSKMIIDYINYFLTFAIAVMFVAIVILRSKSGYLFPGIFVCGAIMNGLTAAKLLMNGKRLPGSVIMVIAVALLCLAALTLRIVLR